jgi:hypothetical protein
MMARPNLTAALLPDINKGETHMEHESLKDTFLHLWNHNRPLVIAGGVIVLIGLYLLYKNQQVAPATDTSGAASTDTTGTGLDTSGQNTSTYLSPALNSPGNVAPPVNSTGTVIQPPNVPAPTPILPTPVIPTPVVAQAAQAAATVAAAVVSHPSGIVENHTTLSTLAGGPMAHTTPKPKPKPVKAVKPAGSPGTPKGGVALSTILKLQQTQYEAAPSSDKGNSANFAVQGPR